MATDSLVNRYKRYKTGTTKIVNWLANTARGLRDVTPILPTLRAANDASKQAKKSKPNLPCPDTRVTVTTSQLFELAKIVANASVTLPDDIVATIDDVISGRRICADWYSTLTATPDEDLARANKGHAYFIDVLLNIKQLLGSRCKTSHLEDTAKAEKPPTLRAESHAQDALSNIFEYLQVDEPSQNPLGKTSTSQRSANKVTFALQNSEEDKTFAIWCLLQDLCDLRREVRSLWTDYQAGKLTFTTAAIVTTISVFLSRYAETELLESFPDLSYDMVVRHMGLSVDAVGTNICFYAEKGSNIERTKGHEINGNGVGELFCPRAWLLMNTFRAAMGVNFGKCSFIEDPSPPSVQELMTMFNFHGFGLSLRTVLPEIELESKWLVTEPSVDEFFTGLAFMAKHPTSVLPLWLVTACQIYIDCFDIAGSEFELGMLYYHERLITDEEWVSKVLTAWTSEKGVDQTMVAEVVLKHKEIKQRFKDIYADAFQKHKETITLTKDEKIPPFRMFKALPLAPGTMATLCAMRMHDLGIHLCSTTKVLLSMAYLYRAALKAGAVTKEWSDMEFAIDMLSKDRPFVLESDSGLTSLPKLFGLALGVKLTAFKSGQRPRLPNVHLVARDSRHVESRLPLMQAMAGQKDARSSWTYYDRSMVNAAILSLERLEKVGSKDTRLDGLLKQWREVRRLTPSQLLIGLKEAIVVDEPELNFNWLSLFLSCDAMLEQVYHVNASGLEVLNKTKKFNLSYCYEVVYATLWDAADRCADPDRLQHSLLFAAGRLLRTHIEEHGDSLTKSALSQSSGYLPEKENIDQAKEEAKTDRLMLERMLRRMGASVGSSDDADRYFDSKEEVDFRRQADQQMREMLASDPNGSTYRHQYPPAVQAMIARNNKLMTDDEKRQSNAETHYLISKYCRNERAREDFVRFGGGTSQSL